MTERALLPVAFCYTRGTAAIAGATRFQKLVFLAQRETALPSAFEYRPDAFGPYAPGLTAALDALDEADLLERDVVPNAEGLEAHDYFLTGRGVRLARRMLGEASHGPAFDAAERIREAYDDASTTALLRYVRSTYPEYADDDGPAPDRFRDPDANAQYLNAEPESRDGTPLDADPEELVPVE